MPTASWGWTPRSRSSYSTGWPKTACQPPRVYYHQWQPGEAVIWDNRRLMHRALPYDMSQPRRMWHTRIAGERVSELATNYA